MLVIITFGLLSSNRVVIFVANSSSALRKQTHWLITRSHQMNSVECNQLPWSTWMWKRVYSFAYERFNIWSHRYTGIISFPWCPFVFMRIHTTFMISAEIKIKNKKANNCKTLHLKVIKTVGFFFYSDLINRLFCSFVWIGLFLQF